MRQDERLLEAYFGVGGAGRVTELVQHVVDALSVGSTYALLALGLTLVFSVMRLINFAYGMMLVWAGYIAIVLLDAGVPFLLMVPLCVAFATCSRWSSGGSRSARSSARRRSRC